MKEVLSFKIEEELRERFIKLCKDNSLKHAEVLAVLIDDWVKEVENAR
jgi:predicted DNA-binding protein